MLKLLLSERSLHDDDTEAFENTLQSIWNLSICHSACRLQRLIIVSQARDERSGLYVCQDLADHSNPTFIDFCLRLWHSAVFAEWLLLDLSTQVAAMREFYQESRMTREFLGGQLPAPSRLMPNAALKGEQTIFETEFTLAAKLYAANAISYPSSTTMHSDPRIDCILRKTEALSGNVGMSLKVLSYETGLSPKYLGSLFLDGLELPFRKYQRVTRMKFVLKSLLSKAAKTRDIGVSLGYTDIANFYRDFKSFFGITPSNFRDQRA